MSFKSVALRTDILHGSLHFTAHGHCLHEVSFLMASHAHLHTPASNMVWWPKSNIHFQSCRYSCHITLKTQRLSNQTGKIAGKSSILQTCLCHVMSCFAGIWVSFMRYFFLRITIVSLRGPWTVHRTIIHWFEAVFGQDPNHHRRHLFLFFKTPFNIHQLTSTTSILNLQVLWWVHLEISCVLFFFCPGSTIRTESYMGKSGP